MSDSSVYPGLVPDAASRFLSTERCPDLSLRMLALSQIKGFGPVRLKSFTEQIQLQTGKCPDHAEFWQEVVRTLPYLIKDSTVLDRALKRLDNPLTGDWSDRDTILRWLEHSAAHHLIALGQESYPWLLQQIPDPPALLFLSGNPQLLHLPQLAVVGSRKPTANGFNDARCFSRALAELGWGITSGLAEGIDAAAHQGALESGGATIAVLGTGIDRIYPARNQSLFEQIQQQGLLVSEYPLGTPPRGPNFPKRNRIVSGLSVGVLVVEAALKSGSLISARLAAEQDREVFAIPGSIHQPQNKGCHQLIRQGAKLTETVEDIHAELQHWFSMACDPESGALNAMYHPEQACLFPAPADIGTSENPLLSVDPVIPASTDTVESPQPIVSEQHQPLVDAIQNGAGHVDGLVMATGLTATDVQTGLLMLELQGVLIQKDGLYCMRNG